MREGAADTAADAAEEEQVWGPGECHAAFLGQNRGSGGRTLLTKSLPLSSQGNQLRKMLLQNYLQNRKSGPRGELTDPTGSGQCHGPALPRLAWLALASNRCLSHAASPQGLDQDWSAIAATQCRLDKEGATKLVCDLITSTKNEKIFQESIGLAIRLLDGGNTEIHVWGSELRSSGLEGGAVVPGTDHG